MSCKSYIHQLVLFACFLHCEYECVRSFRMSLIRQEVSWMYTGKLFWEAYKLIQNKSPILRFLISVIYLKINTLWTLLAVWNSFANKLVSKFPFGWCIDTYKSTSSLSAERGGGRTQKFTRTSCLISNHVTFSRWVPERDTPTVLINLIPTNSTSRASFHGARCWLHHDGRLWTAQ